MGVDGDRNGNPIGISGKKTPPLNYREITLGAFRGERPFSSPPPPIIADLRPSGSVGPEWMGEGRDGTSAAGERMDVRGGSRSAPARQRPRPLGDS